MISPQELSAVSEGHLLVPVCVLTQPLVSDVNTNQRNAHAAWELIAGDIHRTVPTTAEALFNTLCQVADDIPLRLPIDIRAVAFQLDGYFFFQQNFRGSIEETSRAFSQELQSKTVRPKYLFAFMETVLEICGPRELGLCITIICKVEPFLTEIIQCTAERDIVDFIATFAICCPVEPRQMYSDQSLATTQLAVFYSFIQLLPPRSSITRLFLSAARKLQRRLVPVLLWLFVAARPELASRFVSELAVEWKGRYIVLKKLLWFLWRRWRECPGRDGAHFCPYFGALCFAADQYFGLKEVNLMLEQEFRRSGFGRWYLCERGQRRNSLMPDGDVKEQQMQHNTHIKHLKEQQKQQQNIWQGSRASRFRRYRADF